MVEKHTYSSDIGYSQLLKLYKQTDKSTLLWVLAPLLMLLPMLNVRLFPMVAPNEEPKWAVLILCGVWLALTSLWVFWKRASMPKFVWTWPGVALLLFYSLLLMGVWIAPNQIDGLIRFSFWLACLGVFFTACWAWRHVPIFQAAWVWLVSLSSVIFSFGYWRGYLLDYGTPNYNISVLFSPIGHVNFTGDVLVILLPVLMYLLVTQGHAVLRVLNFFSVVTIATVLLVASSRGALGGLALGALCFAVLFMRHRRVCLPLLWRLGKRRISSVLLVAALFTSVIIYELLPYHYRDIARLSGTVQNAGEVVVKPLSENVAQPPMAEFWNNMRPLLGARTGMYASATAMLWDAPLLGHGTGNFYAVYPKYSNHFVDFRDSLSTPQTFTTNPHNVVLQIATQQGLIATMLFMSLLLFFLGRMFITVWRQWHAWLATGVLGITAALFDAMFNHVFFNPASMFSFALFAACWWAALPVMRGKALSLLSIQRLKQPIIIALAMIVLVLSVWPLRWVVSEYYVGDAMAQLRQAQSPAASDTAYAQAYAWDQDNFRALFGIANIAYRQKRYADLVNNMEYFIHIYPYNPPALNLLGVGYLLRGEHARAIEMFDASLFISPDFDMVKKNKAYAQSLLYHQ